MRTLLRFERMGQTLLVSSPARDTEQVSGGWRITGH